MKHMDIIQEVEGKLQEVVEESIRRGLRGNNISDINIYFREEYIEVGLKILKSIYEGIEEEIYRSRQRKERYEVIKKDGRNILTSIGSLRYERRLYKDKKTKERKYLFDEKVGIERSKLTTLDADVKIVEEAIDTSYRRGGINASISDKVTKMTVKNILDKIVVPHKDYVVIKKRKVEYLYIDADEDHIALQRENSYSEINKLIYVYEGVESVAPKSKRHRLINVHYFGGICEKVKDNQALWEKVRRYIIENYDIKSIKKIYLGGDGGQWIKEGRYLFNNVEFVMDEFHIKKYVYSITSHMRDSQDEAIDRLYEILRKKDKKGLEKYIDTIYSYAKKDEDKRKIKEDGKYFINNFESIVLRLVHKEYIVGCSAEGHVSHILASRMSSRPMGWTIEGANKITALRLYRSNGNSIYDLIKANYEVNRMITLKSDMEEDSVYSAEYVINDINKHNKKVLKYVDIYQNELTPLGKEMFKIHNIK